MRDMKELEQYGKQILSKELGKITYAVRKELNGLSNMLDIERWQIEYVFIKGFADICEQNPDDEFEDEEDD